MTIYLHDADVTLYHGDVLDVLRELPDESVDCAATSPPFYGLRDYGVDGQIGLEASPEEWRDRLVEVFREVRRVLVPTGTLWVECGDSYVSGQGGRQSAVGELPPTTRSDRVEPGVRDDLPDPPASWSTRNTSPRFYPGRETRLKPKDVLGAPFLLAFGLREDGWWWRSTNIWHKPNCLPESVTDRPVVQHSYVFQFSKRARYYHDAEAVREPAEWARWGDQTVVKEQQGKGAWIGPNSKEYLTQGRTTNGPRSTENREQTPGFEQRLVSADGTKALRSVWTIPTEGFPEAHFATWPTKLAERILLMACPEQVCRVCNVPRTRLVARTFEPQTDVSREKGIKGHAGQKPAAPENGWQGFPRGSTSTETLGFTDCGHADYRPGIVLDPFAGSGTTMFVARKLARHSIGIDLSAEYLALAARRLQQQSLFAEVT